MIPNAIDAEKFEFNEIIRDEYRRKLDVQDKFVICHVGRITRQKNPYRLVDIFEKVRKKAKRKVRLEISVRVYTETTLALMKMIIIYPF